MKITLILIMVFISQVSNAQRSLVYLDGKTFRGTATEITPPDIDRMPKVFAESISFSNGMMTATTLRNFSVSETPYWYEKDERRMIATDVYVIKAKPTGEKDGTSVEIEFTGDASDGTKLTGILVVKFSDNYEETYSIEAELER